MVRRKTRCDWSEFMDAIFVHRPITAHSYCHCCMYGITAISPAYPGRINMWFERRKPGNTSAFTPGFRPRERHPRCRGRCPRICGADKVLEDEDDRDLSVCRVLEVDVLVDENREDVDLEKKNLEGRSPMSRTSRTMSSRSKDRVQQIENQVLDDLKRGPRYRERHRQSP